MSKLVFLIFFAVYTLHQRNFVSGDFVTLSDIFSNLQNAKSLFASVLSGFNDLMKSVAKTIDAAIDEHCEYKCPNGRTPKPSHLRKPKSNGCGVPGLQIPKYVPISKLEQCCDDHDLCYSTCNSNQQRCDAKFKECLYKICTSLERYISDDFLKGCKVIAKTMYTAVTAMGCKYYLDAQRQACVCDESMHNEF